MLAFPAAQSAHGRLVLDVGDANLRFKRYLDQRIALTIENDHVEHIEGDGADAELLRSCIAAWGARSAHAVIHVGYGLNAAARWDGLTTTEPAGFSGTELRAFAGNFLYSTGPNEAAQRVSRGHLDWPLRHCTIALDGEVVVRAGRVVG